MSLKRILGLAIAVSALASSAALAATGTPERVRGTIASATADSVTVDTYADKPVTVALTGSTSYGFVTLSNREREATVLRAISGGGDGFAPRAHRRGPKLAMGSS
jgi:phosphate-selective porin